MRSAMRLRAASSKLPALLALLGALLPGLGEAELSVYPTEATVLRGSSLLVNCSDSCEDVGLETPITKEKVSEGDTWKTFLRSGVQEDSEPLCFSNCGQQDMLLLPITVYWSPESIELAPLPPWQPVGENLTLSCQIKGGAPRSNLTAVLLRGDEVLSRQPVPGDPTKLVEVMAEVPVRREDHGANFSCRTELDLRSRGLELFENSSAPLQLRTFVSTCSCNCQMRSSTWARSCRPSSSSFCDSMCSSLLGMPKKFQGENSKSAAARARKAEAKAAADARKQQELEDAYWKDEDKHVMRKEQRKEEKEKRRLEQLERKKETQRLLEEEASKLKGGKAPRPAAPGKVTRAQIEETLRRDQAHKDGPEPAEKAKSHLEVPLEENLNRRVSEEGSLEARTVEDAIAVLSVAEEADRHPERRMRAAYTAFEEAQLPRLKQENPNMRLSQLRQLLKKEWQRSPDNPLNQRSAAFNAPK